MQESEGVKPLDVGVYDLTNRDHLRRFIDVNSAYCQAKLEDMRDRGEISADLRYAISVIEDLSQSLLELEKRVHELEANNEMES